MRSWKWLRLLVFFALLLVLLGAAAAHVAQQELQTASFFSAELERAHIETDVSAGGAPFIVKNGAIEASGYLSPALRLSVLRTAYALAFARRAPILGIAGTDPKALAQAIQQLRDAAAALAALQPSPPDALRVRDSLYPLRYLDSLAALEAARQRFIASGADTDERSYEQMIQKTLYAGMRDATGFSGAFDALTATSTERISTLGGSFSRTSLRSSLAATLKRLGEAAALARSREACLEGLLADCAPGALALSIAPEPEEELPAGALPIFPEESSSYVELEHSSCLAALPGPYLFRWNASYPDRAKLFFWGDLYFTPVASAPGSPVLKKLRASLGIDYALQNPLDFYVCPEAMSDIGGVEAVAAAVAYAQAHPSYAPAERARLLSGTFYRQSDAADYLRAVASQFQTETPAPQDARALEEIFAMWQERSAGLDWFISSMAEINLRDIELLHRGFQFSMKASELFLTHSAFPSLFLGQNSGAGASALPPRALIGSDQQALWNHTISYSTLRLKVPREKILHDLDAFGEFEGSLNRLLQ